MRPKGETDLKAIVLVSVVGPIGVPMVESMYPPVLTTDGTPMNAMNDYVIRMNKGGTAACQGFMVADTVRHAE